MIPTVAYGPGKVIIVERRPGRPVRGPRRDQATADRAIEGEQQVSRISVIVNQIGHVVRHTLAAVEHRVADLTFLNSSGVEPE